ncbi:MAG: Na+/H+ antiporter NhaA [Phocaeicola sp.]
MSHNTEFTEGLQLNSLNFSFQRAFKYHVNGGILLMFIVVIAMFLANSPWGELYTSFWKQEVHLEIGSFDFFKHDGKPMTLLSFINDALMTVFFFTVGLEIKREVLVGELSSVKQALLPIAAAFGGMIVPVLFFYIMTKNTEAEIGMAIPMATDIAFSLGVLSLFNKRVPLSLKIFLTAFAVVDDIGGILVIAIFYSSHLIANYLLYSAVVLLALCLGNFIHIRSRYFYLSLGLLLWYFFLQSGIHATIAGVIVAFTIPATPHFHAGKYIRIIQEQISQFPIFKEGPNLVLTKIQINILKSIESASDRVISTLQSLEDDLHRSVNYLIIPLFAFANAGVILTNSDGTKTKIGILTWAITVALVLGKFIGIYLFTWGAVRLKFARVPLGMNWCNLAGISLLGGVGFTVSLFISDLSFGDFPILLNQAKLGVLCGTALATILAVVVLYYTLPQNNSTLNKKL